MIERRDRIHGCLFGLALGDAWGAPGEFWSVEQIRARWPPDGPPGPAVGRWRVTDDTQMALAVGEALLSAKGAALTAERVEPELRAAFVAWLDDPENTRAPGMTCLQACERLAAGQSWLAATVRGSKGCGATMRVAPVGLLPDGPAVGAATRAALAQFQAALTHGHPTALAAADLTAFAISRLMACGAAAGGRLLDELRQYASDQRETYHREWLGDLWQQPGLERPADWIARGWDECQAALERTAAALPAADPAQDPCLLTGAGWVAEESLATALLCFLAFPGEPLRAVRWAAVSSGDSDSIASLAGALAGAALGRAAWPADWLERIEYRARLAALADGLAGWM